MSKSEKKSFWWQELPYSELVDRSKECDIALLPLGAIERHGEHLPTGEDTYHAIGVLERVAEKTSAIILPPPWYGTHPCHHWYNPGTIPLRDETFVNMIVDIVRGVSYAGYNKVIMFNSHGQEWAVPSAVHQLGLEGYFVIGLTLWEIIKEKLASKEILETFFVHAGEAETSVELYLHPELVDMERAHDEVPEGLIDRKWVAGPSTIVTKHIPWYAGTVSKPEYKYSKHGVFGYPTKATKEKGEKIVNAAVNWIVEFIEDIKERYPAGVKPEVK